MTNRLRELWTRGETAFGAWIMLSGPAGAEMVASVGFDYVGIDGQHGLFGPGDMRDMLLTLTGGDATPVARVGANDPALIGKALDFGAHGVIVPLVNSAEEAERAAVACRFPPDGERSFGLARGRQTLGRDPAEINREVLCLPMIETRQAVDAADEICTVPGVDGIYIGPSDLALSLGYSPMGGEQPAEHAEAIEHVRQACERNGIVPAIQVMNGAQAAERAKQGFKMVTIVADAALLAIGSITELGAARG